MFVDRVEYNRRLSICNTCSDFKRSTQQCNLCNCVMPIKAFLKKTASGEVKCPHPEGNKWNEHETNTSAYSRSTSS
jgi:hypothetical protein